MLAVTTVTLAEVLTCPFKAGEEALAKRYRTVLEAWTLVAFDADIAEGAARRGCVARTDSSCPMPSNWPAHWRSMPMR